MVLGYGVGVPVSGRVSVPTRDALARVAEDELGGVSLDEALQIVLFEHQTTKALVRLAADPLAMDEYRAESASIAEADVALGDW
jgi:hypothetical protein